MCVSYVVPCIVGILFSGNDSPFNMTGGVTRLHLFKVIPHVKSHPQQGCINGSTVSSKNFWLQSHFPATASSTALDFKSLKKVLGNQDSFIYSIWSLQWLILGYWVYTLISKMNVLYFNKPFIFCMFRESITNLFSCVPIYSVIFLVFMYTYTSCDGIMF